MATVLVLLPVGSVTAADADDDGLSDVDEGTHGTDVNNRDSDADGLWDGWEVNQTVLTTSLAGADPMKRDLFIEIDRFTTAVSTAATQTYITNQLTNAFARENIVLHLEWPSASFPDSKILPDEPIVKVSRWKALREANFDLRVKALTHRHVLFVRELQRDDGAPLDGRADDVPGQTFALATLKPWGSPSTDVDLTATFLHELGHTLGLGHGGMKPGFFWGVNPDWDERKPNHLSVMNFSWSDTGLLRVVGGFTVPEFDYQQVPLGELEESDLNEPAGLAASDPRLTGLFTMTRLRGQELIPGKLFQANGPIDWNGDLDVADVNVQESVDGDQDIGETLTETLREWDYIELEAGRIGSAFRFWLASP